MCRAGAPQLCSVTVLQSGLSVVRKKEIRLKDRESNDGKQRQPTTHAHDVVEEQAGGIRTMTAQMSPIPSGPLMPSRLFIAMISFYNIFNCASNGVIAAATARAMSSPRSPSIIGNHCWRTSRCLHNISKVHRSGCGVQILFCLAGMFPASLLTVFVVCFPELFAVLAVRPLLPRSVGRLHLLPVFF